MTALSFVWVHPYSSDVTVGILHLYICDCVLTYKETRRPVLVVYWLLTFSGYDWSSSTHCTVNAGATP